MELSHVVKGPLMASRPTSRRPTTAGGNAQQHGQGDTAQKAGKALSGPKKQLFSGDDTAQDTQQQQPEKQHHQSDFFARLFGCFAPQVEIR